MDRIERQVSKKNVIIYTAVNTSNSQNGCEIINHGSILTFGLFRRSLCESIKSNFFIKILHLSKSLKI